MLRFSGVLFSCVVATAFLASTFCVAQQPPPQLAQIIEAWKQREEQVRTAKFVWKETRTQAKGYVSDTLGRLAKKPGQTIPPEDTTFTVPAELLLQDSNFRFTFGDSQWSTGEDVKLVKQDTVAVQSQKNNLTVMPDRTNFGTWPIATIYGQPVNPYRAEVTLRPFWTTFRGITSALYAVELTEYTVQPQMVRLNGVECLALLRQASPNRTERLWVAPSRGYALIRQAEFEGTQIRFQLTVNYRTENGVWCPDRWEIINLDTAGKLKYTVKGEMSSVELNPTVTPADFEVALPPGCAVNDIKSKQQYIILPTEVKRHLANEDAGKSYEELVTTGLAAQPSWGVFGAPFVWITTGVIALGLMTLWVLRRRFRPSSDGPA